MDWEPNPRAKEVLANMKVWLSYGHREKPLKDDRTTEEQAWDSAVLACAEFVRRYMDYDERIALQVHGLLSRRKATIQVEVSRKE